MTDSVGSMTVPVGAATFILEYCAHLLMPKIRPNKRQRYPGQNINGCHGEIIEQVL